MHQNVNADAVDAVMAESGLGVDVSKLRVGTVLIVETLTWMYQVTVHDPFLGTVSLESGDPSFSGDSLYEFQGAIVTKTKTIPLWIGKGMPMAIRFRDGVRISAPVQSVTVCGDGWHYEVF